MTAGPEERIAELERDLSEALERQSAAAHVLEVLGTSTFELDPVFETVLQQAWAPAEAPSGLPCVVERQVGAVGRVQRCGGQWWPLLSSSWTSAGVGGSTRSSK